MKRCKIWPYRSFLFVFLLLIVGCGGGGGTSSNSDTSLNPNATQTSTCIIDTFLKEDTLSGSSLCIENFPQEECRAKTDMTGDLHKKGYMVAKSCSALGFETSTPENITDENGKSYNSYTKSEPYSKYMFTKTEDMFPTIDTKSLLHNPPAQKIEMTSADTKYSTKPKESAVVISSSDVVAEGNDSLRIQETLPATKVGEALFVDDEYVGIISALDGDKVTLRDADSIAEVFDELSIEMRTDTLKKALQRGIANGTIKGKYDAINQKPLKISIIDKKSTTRSLSNDSVIRVEFPEGYRVPIEPRSLDCTLTSGECKFLLKNDTTDKIPLGVSTDADNFVVFTTEGSYIEYSIGTYINMYYNHNIIAKDEFAFNYVQKANFKAALKFKLSADATKLSNNMSWETNFQPMGDMEVEIAHPYSHIAKTEIIIVPTITLGVEGKLSGYITYHTGVQRTGNIVAQYDSRTGQHTFSSDLKDATNQLGKDSMDIVMEASASAYCFPNFTFIPAMRILRVSAPIQFASLRSGVKLDNVIAGKIQKGFVASAEGLSTSSVSEVSVTSAVSGLVQGKWSVKYGKGKGSQVFYESKEYTTIKETTPNKIFEWKMRTLSDPIVRIHNDPSDENTKLLSFGTNDAGLEGFLYYYYTLGDDEASTKDIDLEKLESHKLVYRAGDSPIKITKNQVVKVVAVLYNKDISDSIWSFGKSVSKQVKAEIQNIIKPTVSPNLGAFEESIEVTLTQPQGYDIYYSLNGGANLLYTSPITLSETTTLQAYASSEINGVKTLSEKISVTYTKCLENQKVENGICVESIDSKFDLENPTAEWCPINYDASLDTTNDGIKNLYIITGIGNLDKVDCKYYPSGSLMTEIPYVLPAQSYARINGVAKHWFDDNSIYILNFYDNGERNKELTYKTSPYHYLYSITHYHNGKVNGKYQEFYPSGKLHWEIFYVDGQIDGVATEYWSLGEIKEKDYYTKGVIQSKERFDQNGCMFGKLFYKDGRFFKSETYDCN